ncbi:MAG: FtsW/RodA/SpoVE family cell cycle protein [Lewinellaceae bacterium]|nr:FtsW/RodA/SpoVE family cell cycle protein [Saprospiraceae bacterium]MCB9308152.1 FtsW/RodA/SpoVE family cell cycle protein [Lewinellaceae bacterium]MCB9354779.1 FtsW/RodA/SpoVE family cell cycle protein [Lewinellaceae bacterium]
MSLGNRIAAELRGDRTIWMIIAVLSLFSLLAVYSASGWEAWRARGGNTTVMFVAHMMRLAFGLFLIYLCHLLHYRQYQRIAPILILACVPLLAFTLFYGRSINDAPRWIEVFGLSFQPSEMAKIALIIYIARELTRKQDYISSLKDAFMPIIIPVLLICGLIAPANLSSALVLFVTCILLMFIGRVRAKYIFLLGLLGVVVFAGLIVIGQMYPEADLVRVDTWASRMQIFLHSEDGGYQVQQAKIAIAKGGIIGQGPGNSIIRNFLPYAHADFIYAIICEEYGLLGGTVVLVLYVLLFLRNVKLVTKSPKAFGAFLAIGLSLLLTVQALANIAVNVNLVPATGLTLPLISMGGTSMLFTCISLGMILSVSKFIEGLE